MNPRPHHAFAAALATALVGAAPTPATAAKTTTDTVTRCVTAALTDAEVAAGQTSQVTCVEVAVGTPLQRSSTVVARHYDGTSGTGTILEVTGSDCTGNTVFLSTDWWNNRISSTQHTVCGYVKHWSSDSFSGSNQLLGDGTVGATNNLNATMNNQSSSIEYA